jgi:hypothetical protein
LLKKLTKKLDLYEAESAESLRKAQRILANLRVYEILKMLVQKAHNNLEFREVVCTLHRFLLGFIRENDENKRLVAVEFSLFASCDPSVWLPELLKQLFGYALDKEAMFRQLLGING